MSALLTLGTDPTAPPRFTHVSEEQAQALVADRELAIVAGAGAGKTSTLAARYVLLLHTLIVDSGVAPDPRAVLVLTFTERAATEMRERCLTMVNAMAEASLTAATTAASPAHRDAFQRAARIWGQIRDRFPGAAISTFHSFCKRLLHEFPSETRTAPHVRILDEPTARRRRSAAALEAVLHLLDVGGDDAQLAQWTWGGAGPLVATVDTLLSRRGELRDTLQRYAAGRTPDAELAEAGGTTFAVAAQQLLVIADILSRIVQVTQPTSKPWLDHLRIVEAQLSEPSSGDSLETTERLGKALACLRGSKGRRNLSDPSSMGRKEAYGKDHAAAVAALKEIQVELDKWEPAILASEELPNRHDRTLAEVQTLLARTTLDAQARLVARLDDLQELDFTELIARARSAVVEGTLAPALRARHAFVMVDEFQDTDVDQWALVEAITRGPVAAGPQGPNEGAQRRRLFVVGDPKQSIYGFRGGDVAVFERVRRTIASSFVFADNHRSRPAIVDFSNLAFASILARWGGDAAIWQVGYNPMRTAGKRKGGSVVLATADAQKPAANDVRSEAEYIATTVRDRVLGGLGPWSGTAYADAQLHPKPPIAILLRRRKHLPVFENALRRAGIPTLVAEGSGFWHRQEVLDLAHTLRALITGDTLSLVGALRSPLFGLPDRLLAELAQAKRLHDFGVGEPPASSETRLAVAWARWAALRVQSGRLSVARFLELLLHDSQSSWLLSVESPDGRAEANVQQLLRFADEADREGTSPLAFAQGVLDRAAREERESEAALPDSAARVVLLTIHASKGLEYPVVIVPECGSRLDRRARSAITTSRGSDGAWELTFSVPDRWAPILGLVKPPALFRAQRVLAEMELAELRRLFYVACTRAEDHLILVGHRAAPTASGPSPDASWLAMLDAALVDSVVQSEAIPPAGQGGAQSAAVVVPPLEAEPPELESSLTPLPSRRIWVLAPSGLEHALSAAGLLPPQFSPIPSTVADAGAERREELHPGREIAAVRGTVLHGLLEDDCIDDDAIASDRWLATGRAEGLSEDVLAQGWPAVLRQLHTMRRSGDVERVLRADGLSEVAVRLDIGDVRIEGRLDRLCRDGADHAWMVVDYKTEDPGPDPNATAAHHRLQLFAYSLAASAVLEGQGQGRVVRGAVLFTRTGALVRLADWTKQEEQSLLASIAALPNALRGSPA